MQSKDNFYFLQHGIFIRFRRRRSTVVLAAPEDPGEFVFAGKL